MTIGTVIVTFRTPVHLMRECLTSLQQNGCHQVVVVANDRADDVRALAAAQRAHYCAPAANRGFAAAANLGAGQLKTDLVLFLNPDAALESGALARAGSYLATHPACGIVGLLLTSPRGTPEPRAFGAKVTPLSLIARRFTATTLPAQPQPVGWVSGGALLIRRALFTRLHGFDEHFFLYWEDVDLCRRASILGLPVVVLPNARAVHQRGASLRDAALKTALYDASADKYFRKYYAPWICRSLSSLRFLYRMFSPQVE